MHERREQPDAELVLCVQAGKSEAFAELVWRYQSALTRVARSRLGRDDWAEEAVQEAFLAAFKGLASYDPRRNFRTWLWTILLHECHRHYQRRARSVPLEPWSAERAAASESTVEHDANPPLENLVARERAAELEALLARLSTAQADALRLRFFGGLKFQEIAEAMQCSLNTAKNRVRTGLTRMGELLQTSQIAWESRGDEDRGELP